MYTTSKGRRCQSEKGRSEEEVTLGKERAEDKKGRGQNIQAEFGGRRNGGEGKQGERSHCIQGFNE